jgi:hypothetical protein
MTNGADHVRTRLLCRRVERTEPWTVKYLDILRGCWGRAPASRRLPVLASVKDAVLCSADFLRRTRPQG